MFSLLSSWYLLKLPNDMTASTTLETSTVCQSPKVESMGAFHSTQNSRIFDWYNKWNRPFRFGPTGIFGTSFGDGPLWLVWSFRSVGQKCPFPFDKIVVPSTALLYPAYKNNNQTGSLRKQPHWARGISNISDGNFCWMESAQWY